MILCLYTLLRSLFSNDIVKLCDRLCRLPLDYVDPIGLCGDAPQRISPFYRDDPASVHGFKI